MKNINELLNEIGLSKVKLARYLGVSRQMLYNYLALDKLSQLPKEKEKKLKNLLNIENEDEIKTIKVTDEYINAINDKLEESSENNSKYYQCNLKNFNKKEQEILNKLFSLIQNNLAEDNGKDTYNAYNYLYNFLQSMKNNKELSYVLAYYSKALGFTDPHEFLFNENQQFIFESILFSGMTLYNGKGAAKSRVAEMHKRFVNEIEQKKEERLSRTQELNAARIQALRELGYKDINPSNAKEVLDKIVEIESRRV